MPDYRIEDYQQTGFQRALYRDDTKRSADRRIVIFPDKHNALNATSVISSGERRALMTRRFLAALADFRAGRRFDPLGQFIRPNGKVMLVDDYGHHPTEVGVTDGASGWENKRVVMIFNRIAILVHAICLMTFMPSYLKWTC